MLADNDELDNLFAQMFQVGGAMYLLGTHYTVVKTLLSNPQWSAEKTVGTSSEVNPFTCNPSIKRAKKYLTAICTSTLPLSSQTSKRTKSVKRNLTSLLDSNSDEESNTAEVSAKVVEAKKKKTKHRNYDISVTSHCPWSVPL